MTTTFSPSTARRTTASPADDVRQPRISRRAAVASAVGAGVGWMTFGVLNLVDGEAVRAVEDVSTIWHVGLAIFSISLLLGVAPLLYLARFARSAIGARAAALGHVTIALLATSSNLNGGDYSWFSFVGIPGNLLIFGGVIALTVSLMRAKRLPRYVAVLPLWYVFAFPMAIIAMGIAAGLVWLGVARTIATAPAER